MTTPKKKLWPVSRRAFLGGLGAVGFSHLLPSGRLAHAQTGGPKRFVAIYVPEGMWAGVRTAATRPRSGSVFGPMDQFSARRSSRSTGSTLATALADKPGVDNHHRLPHLLGCTKMVNGVTGGGPTTRSENREGGRCQQHLRIAAVRRADRLHGWIRSTDLEGGGRTAARHAGPLHGLQPHLRRWHGAGTAADARARHAGATGALRSAQERARLLAG